MAERCGVAVTPRIRWRDLSPVGQVTWFAIVSAILYGILRLAVGCSSDSSDDSHHGSCVAGSSQASAGGAQAGSGGSQAGAGGAKAGTGGTGGAKAGAGGVGGSPTIPPGCTIVPGGGADCSIDKKSWLVECAFAPVDCQPHTVIKTLYCCKIYP